MNGNLGQFSQEQGSGNASGRIITVLLVVGVLLLLAGVVWTIFTGTPSAPADDGGNKSMIAISPAILGSLVTVIAATSRRRRYGAPASRGALMIAFVAVGVVVLAIIAVVTGLI